MSTRSLLIVVAFAANSLVGFGQEKPAAQTHFSVALSAPELTVKVGAPVIVSIVVKNISDHTIGQYETSVPALCCKFVSDP